MGKLLSICTLCQILLYGQIKDETDGVCSIYGRHIEKPRDG